MEKEKLYLDPCRYSVPRPTYLSSFVFVLWCGSSLRAVLCVSVGWFNCSPCFRLGLVVDVDDFVVVCRNFCVPRRLLTKTK